jgi:8-oxo-dGTP pyrophosphatase MutT (NUDIX family)
MLDLDAARDPVVPQDAATVIVLRQRGARVEVFCVKRHGKSGFLGGALVFPGGKVAAEDRELDWSALTNGLKNRADSVATEPLPFAVAALRELFEEATLLALAREHADGAATQYRQRLKELSADDEPHAFHSLLTEADLLLDTSRLHALSRWITPKAEKRRYDTRFYLLPFDESQAGLHDAYETTSSFWATPKEVLARWEKEEVFLAPPTSHTLELLSEARSVADALERAAHVPLSPVCPHLAMVGDQMVLALPGDPLFPEETAAPSDPAAPTRFVLSGARFLPRRA